MFDKPLFMNDVHSNGNFHFSYFVSYQTLRAILTYITESMIFVELHIASTIFYNYTSVSSGIIILFRLIIFFFIFFFLLIVRLNNISFDVKHKRWECECVLLSIFWTSFQNISNNLGYCKLIIFIFFFNLYGMFYFVLFVYNSFDKSVISFPLQSKYSVYEFSIIMSSSGSIFYIIYYIIIICLRDISQCLWLVFLGFLSIDSTYQFIVQAIVSIW